MVNSCDASTAVVIVIMTSLVHVTMDVPVSRTHWQGRDESSFPVHAPDVRVESELLHDPNLRRMIVYLENSGRRVIAHCPLSIRSQVPTPAWTRFPPLSAAARNHQQGW